MKRAGKKTFATFLLSPFFPSFCPFFRGPSWGAQAPQAPPWVRRWKTAHALMHGEDLNSGPTLYLFELCFNGTNPWRIFFVQCLK